MTRRLLAAAIAIAVLLTPVGCTGDEPTGRESVETVSGLFDKIDELRRTNKTAPLSSLTEFSWDGVFCYYEGTPTDEINSAVGGEVEEPGHRLAVTGALAVFVEDGKPVRKATIPELRFETQRYSSEVLVKNGVELTEPG